VGTTKIGTVMGVRNATIVVAIIPRAVEAVVATVVSSALSLLLSRLLSLLCLLSASALNLRSFLCEGKSSGSE